MVIEPKQSWRMRFELLAQQLFAQIPVAFLFDNFEDNLTDGAVPQPLGELLSLWLRRPGKSRLLFTSRHPFKLPDGADDRLAVFPLGPLSWAETRKLFRRLEGLDRLSAEDQRRAYEDVGGHPRGLEYLDALLRGGKAEYPQVQRLLRENLKKLGVDDPSRWCKASITGFDAALAETVTIAAQDVLLDQLLAALDDDPLAKRLIFAASIYRVPVDAMALAWLVGDAIELPADPQREARMTAAQDRFAEARKTDPTIGLEAVLSPDEGAKWNADMSAAARPPIAAPAGFAAALEQLIGLSLLATARFAEDDPDRYLVHRWTAAALAERMREAEAKAAHERAADFWLWRVQKLPQPPWVDIDDLLEARHHFFASGDTQGYFNVSNVIIARYHTWGAWDREERLIHEALAEVPGGSRQAAVYLHQLGLVLQNKGDYDAALDWYRKSLTILEQIGDRAGSARCYHQLGIVAHLKGDYDAALDWYRKSQPILEEIGDCAGVAASYHQQAMVVQEKGDYDAALDGYRKSLAIAEQIGDRAGAGMTYHQLGVVAQLKGDYNQALDWYRKSLAVKEQIGDRAGAAASYHQLGMVAQLKGDYDAALDWYRKSLAIAEEIGDRAGVAASYHQLGTVAQDKGDYDAALDWYRKSLAIAKEIGDRAGEATSYHQLGRVAQDKGDYDMALDWYRKSLAIKEQIGDRAGAAKSYHQLGVVAQLKGDYDAAVDWYRKSLAIKEELGDRAGVAASYHQLGTFAQEKGDYDAALDWYRKSLAITEEIGNRAGMAQSLGQLGAFYLETGKPAEATPFTLRSLAIHLEHGSPQAGLDFRDLSLIKRALGLEPFKAVIAQYCDPETVTTVFQRLDRFEAEQAVGDNASGVIDRNSEERPAAPTRKKGLLSRILGAISGTRRIAVTVC